MMPGVLSTLILFFAGVLAAAVNAVAGGGTLFAFPMLLALGVSPLHANATCSAALWLGGLASAIGYAEQFQKTRGYLRMLFLPSLLGSLVGAWLLSQTSEKIFKQVVPALVLLATVLLAFQPYLRPKEPHRRMPPWVGMLLQFFICVYGGYFGAAMGILMLAMMGLFIEGDLHQFNALKAWLAVLVNVVATAMFLYQGLVQPGPTLVLGIGALTGGYLTARNVKKIAPARLRGIVVVIGLALSVWCGWHALH